MLRARLRELLEREILPALERSFDAMDRGQGVVHVPRMELHATPRRLEDLADVLPALVERGLAPVLRAPVALRRADAIRAYLETGSFPWHVAADDLIALIRADPAVQEEVAGVAPTTAEAVFRALQLLPEEKWSLLAPPLLRREMARIAADQAIVRDTRLRRATALIAARGVSAPPGEGDVPPRREAPSPRTEVPDVETPPSVDAHPPTFIGRAQPMTSGPAAAPAELATQPSHSTAPRQPSAPSETTAPTRSLIPSPVPTPKPDAEVPAPEPETRTLAAELRTASLPLPHIVNAASVTQAGPEREPAQSEPEPRPDRKREAGLDSRLERKLEPAPEPTLPTAAPGHRPDPFGRPAPLAGLILVAPFLPRFLEQTHAKRPDARTIDDLPRAAALLHALAAGDAEPIEHDLAFIKVLLSIDSLQIGGGLLTSADLDEVDALLHAVVDHWSALKKTSPRGLQSTFLRRPGLIREDEHGFLLQVEPSPFDVLLKQLPWTFGVVKLPWMKRAIVTEWRT